MFGAIAGGIASALAGGAMSKLFFFFQAEDGIRDHCVTGVQTCALPISTLRARSASPDVLRSINLVSDELARQVKRHRSEERRVGKECRSRWAAYHQKKKVAPCLNC